jgi:hypothetical protein
MAKVLIEETTLTAIGDAIRGKEGTTDLVPVNDMATRISAIETGGGTDDAPDIELTGVNSYTCSGPVATAFIQLYPTKVTTKDLSTSTYMFSNNRLTEIPFAINFKTGANAISNFFYNAQSLRIIPDFDIKHNSYAAMGSVFNNCFVLENLPKILNAYPSEMGSFFYNCYRLRYIPEDYFDTWNFSRLKTYNYGNMSKLFYGCYSLRKIPSRLFEFADDWTATSATYSMYGSAFYGCHTLDEVLGLPVAISPSMTSNVFSGSFYACYRLARLTFSTNADGTPKIAKWKSQTIDLTSYVGYGDTSGYTKPITRIYSYNSGITEDKNVTDDASYQTLKNDPDWFTADIAYSRYNHDSAVETLKSLPDTSATGTNTIKFKKASGSATDGGAIENLTAEEIAVAAAKGWTVTLV